MKTNSELQRDVLDELVWDPSVDAARVGVAVDNGVVSLHGTVKSLTEKWAAEEAAQRVEGVGAVTNELKVELPGQNLFSDSEIARAVVNALSWHPSIPADQVKIAVQDGAVTLQGNVSYRYQSEMAETLVRQLKGVTGIFNNMVIRPEVHAADVQFKIEKALERSAQIDPDRISVEASGDTVVLHGNVKSWAERELAERAAWSAPGVSQVRNEITVMAPVAA